MNRRTPRKFAHRRVVQRSVGEAVYRTALFSPLNLWVAFAPVSVLMLALSPLDTWWSDVILLVAFGATLLAAYKVLRYTYVHSRWAFVLNDDGRVCPSCGYDLTGNVSGTCPECGTAIVTENNDAGRTG